MEFAKESDAVEMVALCKRVWSEYKGTFPHELVRARRPSLEQMKEWMRQDSYFVAKVASQIVGVIGCSLKHGTYLFMHVVVLSAF